MTSLWPLDDFSTTSSSKPPSTLLVIISSARILPVFTTLILRSQPWRQCFPWLSCFGWCTRYVILLRVLHCIVHIHINIWILFDGLACGSITAALSPLLFDSHSTWQPSSIEAQLCPLLHLDLSYAQFRDSVAKMVTEVSVVGKLKHRVL